MLLSLNAPAHVGGTAGGGATDGGRTRVILVGPGDSASDHNGSDLQGRDRQGFEPTRSFLAARTRQVESFETYDTHWLKRDAARMARDLRRLASGSVVAIACMDECWRRIIVYRSTSVTW